MYASQEKDKEVSMMDSIFAVNYEGRSLAKSKEN